MNFRTRKMVAARDLNSNGTLFGGRCLEWIDEDNNIPTIMFHGTSDGVVPFNSGYPFTIDIFLPIVYGWNLIHDRLNEVGIENELYLEDGEPHEYWGTLNGNWFGGPNEYFDQINTDAFSFLYNLLDIVMIGDVNQEGFIKDVVSRKNSNRWSLDLNTLLTANLNQKYWIN